MKVNVLIDSCGWIEYFGKGPKINEYASFIDNANPKNYYTPSIVLYEVYKKIKEELSDEKAMEACAYMLSYTSIVSLDEKVAFAAADLSSEYGLPMADAVIMATARIYGATIVTSDKHFEKLDDVRFISA